MSRHRVSGPHKDDISGSEYFIVGGTTKHHSERKYYEPNSYNSSELFEI